MCVFSEVCCKNTSYRSIENCFYIETLREAQWRVWHLRMREEHTETWNSEEHRGEPEGNPKMTRESGMQKWECGTEKRGDH